MVARSASWHPVERQSPHFIELLSLPAGVDEGVVGLRGWAPNVYAGYVRDLDGNKLAAYCCTWRAGPITDRASIRAGAIWRRPNHRSLGTPSGRASARPGCRQRMQN